MKYLGIDYGLKKIGIAIGDDTSGMAMPLEVLRVIEGVDVIEMIKNLVASEAIDAVVIGVPKSAGNFHNSKQLELTKKFIEELEVIAEIPVHSIDESYTSVESQRIQDEHGSDVSEDALAAMLILQAYFDQQEKV
jgi:putative holliday junction resolvase